MARMKVAGILMLAVFFVVSEIGSAKLEEPCWPKRRQLLQGGPTKSYYPSTCSKVCKSQEEFMTEIPEEPLGNNAYKWSMILLAQIKTNIGDQSPPGVARALNVFGSCLYNAAAAFKSWKPAYIEEIPGEAPCGLMLVDDVVNGAAFTALSAMFSDKPSFITVAEFWHNQTDGKTNKGMELGEQICDAVVEKFEEDGFDVLGNPLPRTTIDLNYEPSNKGQEVPGLTQCSTEMKDLSKWQPLCVPTEFRPDKPSTTCEVQEWLAPWAGQFQTFAVDDVKQMVPLTGPPEVDSDEYLKQAEEVVEYSANLTDATKLVAEHWADGPDSTFPPGHWFRIAAEAAKKEELDIWETSKVLFMVGAALNDAGVACWECKLHFDSVRPLQMIQCGMDGEEITAWKGPYQGVGEINASEWQPYQKATFVTPPFAGFTSGHSSFSAAAAKVLKLYFGSDEFVAPKCELVEEGLSQFEGKIAKGEEGYIKGVTDVPNKGPTTKGYVPAQDTVMCWETWQEAAEQAGTSRLMGGIHIIADHSGGVRMGEMVAFYVHDKAMSLWTGN